MLLVFNIMEKNTQSTQIGLPFMLFNIYAECLYDILSFLKLKNKTMYWF